MFLEIITSPWTGVVIVLAALILTFRYVCRAEDRLFDMISRAIAANNELGHRLSEFEERLEAAETKAEDAKSFADALEISRVVLEEKFNGSRDKLTERILKTADSIETLEKKFASGKEKSVEYAQQTGIRIDTFEARLERLTAELKETSAQLEKIDFENVNRAIKAQADFDEGFANILNYGLNGSKKE